MSGTGFLIAKAAFTQLFTGNRQRAKHCAPLCGVGGPDLSWEASFSWESCNLPPGLSQQEGPTSAHLYLPPRKRELTFDLEQLPWLFRPEFNPWMVSDGY